MTEQLLTPSKITAWLDCAHYLTLKRQVEDGLLGNARQPFGEFAQLIVDKGVAHETACLEDYRRRGLDIYEVPDWDRGDETFEAWIDRIGDPLSEKHDVIYQMPFVHDGVRGIADFLIRVDDPATGAFGYEPVDAKLARVEAKPGHVLQLCFYADAIEATTGWKAEQIHIWLGSGEVETLRTEDFRAYWNRLRGQLAALLADEPSGTPTAPERCAHCEFCEFAEICEDVWRTADSLMYVAGIRSPDRVALEGSGHLTMAQLAVLDAPVATMQPERLARLVNQASLQVLARTDPDAPPPFQLVPPSPDPTWGHGFDQMPPPDEADVFLDFEGDPFWRADAGLFFLFGYVVRDGNGGWTYEAIWAHDRDEEREATRQLIQYFVDRRAAHPGMHVYHYNHTERSALERLTADHGVSEVALTNLVETGLFVDLLAVARNALQVGAESYGLKYLERLTPFVRGHDIDQGAGAVVEYEQYMGNGDTAILDRIASYNRDDVLATAALHEWLIEHRPDGLDWREACFEPEEGYPELDERVAALLAFGPGSPQYLLGELLGYWLRERLADKAPKLAKLALDTPTLLDDPDVIAGLTFVEQVERMGARGPKLPALRFTFPEQVLTEDFISDRGVSTLYRVAEGPTGYAGLDRLDLETGEVDLVWNDRAQELGEIPTAVVIDDWVHPKPKPEALDGLAAKVLDPEAAGPPNAMAMALLRRDLPVFDAGHGPDGGQFSDDVEAMAAWAGQLDASYLAIQGPPGTGKTYRGARIVHGLVRAGLRVGITAMSHHAIDNLVTAVVEVFDEADEIDSLAVGRRGKEPRTGPEAGVKYPSTNKACANPIFNVVAGTTWFFAGNDMAAAPVDVLIIDEAGQLALADAVAATRSARSLVLLGDPLQLPQVAKAAHPGGGGRSVLEHVLGDHVTIPADRGVFLAETRRMHPDVCRFISEQIYEGRLTSHPSCAIQATEFGTGLRWLPAHHADRSTESIEEAEIVAAEIQKLIGTAWTDQHGVVAPLTAEDFMVVAPYNDQVDLLRAHLDADERTRGVPVGTVDKFQGRQAAVVFFTMTTSSSEAMPRGPEFLFSRNRLNVAVSRARCLAYLVCTEELLNSRARTVEEMRLIATLCAFVEYTEA